jgi:hypothetical protein
VVDWVFEKGAGEAEGLANDVADGEDVEHVGAHLNVHRNKAEG